jgi:hypothetical protein
MYNFTIYIYIPDDAERVVVAYIRICIEIERQSPGWYDSTESDFGKGEGCPAGNRTGLSAANWRAGVIDLNAAMDAASYNYIQKAV